MCATGQVLLQNMLVSATKVTATGSLPIPTGMVAVTVQLCVPEAVAEYVTAGSEVAVFDTYANGRGSTISRTCNPGHEVVNSAAIASPALVDTRIVLTKAEVLAVGQNPSAQGTSPAAPRQLADPASSASALDGSVLVTLAVNQADAERLIMIDEVGLPYMALLGPTSKTAFDNPATPNYLFRP